MGAEDHGGAGGGGVADEPVDEVAAVLVEAGVGLVEQPQLGAAGDEAGQRGAAPLPGREPADGRRRAGGRRGRGAPWPPRRRPGRPAPPGPRTARCRRRSARRRGRWRGPAARPGGERPAGRATRSSPSTTAVALGDRAPGRRGRAAGWSCPRRSARGAARSRRRSTSRSTPARAGKRPSSATAPRRWTTGAAPVGRSRCSGSMGWHEGTCRAVVATKRTPTPRSDAPIRGPEDRIARVPPCSRGASSARSGGS